MCAKGDEGERGWLLALCGGERHLTASGVHGNALLGGGEGERGGDQCGTRTFHGGGQG